MYERFTDTAREIMSAANQVADSWNHEYIGTEHLLIAFVESDEHPGGMILRRFGVDADCVRSAMAEILLPGPEPQQPGLCRKLTEYIVSPRRNPLTPRTKRIIERAMEAARADQSPTIGTEHLLHGICCDDSTVAYQVLLMCGVDMAELQAAVNEARNCGE